MDQSENRITAYRKIRAEATNLLATPGLDASERSRLAEIIAVATLLADSEHSGNFDEVARRCSGELAD